MKHLNAARKPESPRAAMVHSSLSTVHQSSGMALVIVLGMLVLALVLIVAFFSSVSVELQSAKRYSSGSDARALADSAAGIVISQIQDATADPRLAWASQPGMIRTYNDEGDPVTAFKLYSSSILQIEGGFDAIDSQETEVPPNWASHPALYTDLNRPVFAAGRQRFPILDPAAVAADNSGGPALDGTSDPVEGSYLDTGNPAVATSENQPNPVPMPVQWIYVLESGALAANLPGTSSISDASDSDPIVGRVAFWTDDETSKVNINTASEGTFWDRPWTAGIEPSAVTALDGGYERRLAATIPVQNEFQRYPGHPAMTSLSAVFPKLSTESELEYKNRIYGIIPRVSEGGSQSGTHYVTGSTPPVVPDADRLFASIDELLFRANGIPRQANPKGPDSTFSEDDLRKAGFFITAQSRSPEVNLFNKPRISLWPLQANTANVSDPDGAPQRTSKDRLIAFCSTIGDKPFYFQRYNTYGAANPSSQSPFMDYHLIPRNQELYTYLDALTSKPIPGLGGTFSQKYPDSRLQILTQSFDFIRSQVNTFSNMEEGPDHSSKYNYTPFDEERFTTGQGQVVPIVLPNGTKGFGRFLTVTEAALIFYNKDPLTLSGSVPPNGKLTPASGTDIIAQWSEGAQLEDWKIGDVPSQNLKISGTDFTLNQQTEASRTIGAVLILEPFNPTPGPPPWTANVRYVVKGLDAFGMGFSSPLVNMVSSIDSTLNTTSQTGLELNLQKPPRRPKILGPTSESNPDPAYYPFASEFVASGQTMDFPGGTITIEIYQGSARPLSPDDLVQTIELEFPPVEDLPLPLNGRISRVQDGHTYINIVHDNHDTFRDYGNRLQWSKARKAPVAVDDPDYSRWGIAEDGQHSTLPIIIGQTSSPYLGDTVRSVEARYAGPTRGDYRLIAGLRNVPSVFFEGHGEKDPLMGGVPYSATDVTALGGARLVHSLHFDPFPGSGDTGSSNGYYYGAGARDDDRRGKLVAGAPHNNPRRGDTARNSTMPVAPRGLQAATMANGAPGDWDNGVGEIVDGPYINIPDQATSNRNMHDWSLYYTKGGYVQPEGFVESGASFSPNRQIASAVAFGSLPTGINPSDPEESKPWQTLLFCRNPAAKDDHPGFGQPLSGPPYGHLSPPDHAFLDLFTMPIVEPYAISEPFSTAGKVNMNYQIVPFTYLTRSTAVRAVLKATNLMAIDTDEADSYKLHKNNPPDFRYTINPDEKVGTLAGFEERFAAGDIFRSASEICNIFLVPDRRVDGTVPNPAPTYDEMQDWWDDFKLTGDNVREQPYGHIYPRLTTKSNTYTVHVQAQSIVKVPGTPSDEFVEGRDQIMGEFRGSFLIERYLDPNADTLVKADGHTPTNELDPEGMVGPYKFRVINSTRFAH